MIRCSLKLIGPIAALSGAVAVSAGPEVETRADRRAMMASAEPMRLRAPIARGTPSSLSPMASLGKSLFFDTSLSSPAGQSCASCHSPAAGFTFPDSDINAKFGVAPGAVRGRFGSRAVPSISYSAFNPPGPPTLNGPLNLFVGGLFWDGRAADLVDQAKEPFLDPNEMNNVSHGIGDPAMVVKKLAAGPLAGSFRQVFGHDVFSQPTEVVYNHLAEAIAAYERSPEVSPFSSKYDAWRAGEAAFSEDELLGLRLMTASWSGRPDGAPFPRFAHCVACHMIPSVPSGSPDLWTNTCYQNLGVPRNTRNPFYRQTNAATNPFGFNPAGASFVDLGLGNTLYPLRGLPPGNIGPSSDGRGDFLGANGQFKAPSLRNVDRRPEPRFVKAYMHNGALKSLDEVVHFYNTRNLTSQPGEVIDFTRTDPYAGLRGRPLWGKPEFGALTSLLNPEGALGSDPDTFNEGGESSAQVGNLGLTAEEERAIVAFLRTLSDGYFDPNADTSCLKIVSQPVSQEACLGVSLRFTVASNVTHPSYQWRRNGVPIPGEHLSYYQIVSASPLDAGEYDCVVTSDCTSVVSRAADLTISVCGCGSPDLARLMMLLAEPSAGMGIDQFMSIIGAIADGCP